MKHDGIWIEVNFFKWFFSHGKINQIWEREHWCIFYSEMVSSKRQIILFISTYLAFISGVASAQRRPNSLAMSPTPKFGFASFTLGLTSLENQKNADLKNEEGKDFIHAGISVKSNLLTPFHLIPQFNTYSNLAFW